MRLEHEFVVPVSVPQAWDVLLDIERIAPCMPGATLESVTGQDYTGVVRVKLGPVTVSYRGTITVVSADESARIAVLHATGRETRGSGTAEAQITASLLPDGPEATRVSVVTELAITGKPAQFGRGIIADVSARILGQFADRLAAEIAGAPAGPGGAGVRRPAAAAAATAAEPSALNITDVVDLRSLRPLGIAALIGFLLGALWGRRR